MRDVHFQVVSIQREGSRVFVGGRNCGDALALGDVLRGVSGDVRVDAILTYGRYLNALDPGLTAELELSGDGVATVEPGFDLRGQSQRAAPRIELLGEGEFHVTPV